ncbi:MAG: deoxyuridine 5'-triphosphate nucleotidohydrolase [Omnitrophica bacterium RIFCSPHIGHO2_02_FULL_51_18]|nr:MAG: deoxyuridine 5'-triphosphate nucleotidohydrolase [Omnitrophica bacterium RIFCSPHIGHO2_02_FULL_51_18]
MKTVKIQVKRSPGTEDITLPAYMSAGASGMDLCAAVDGDLAIMPGEIKLISTGISVSIPRGFEAQIRPRSGLALKHGITFVNTPGTIDSDYRGVISLIVTNLGRELYVIKRGARVAQMVIQEIVKADIEIVGQLENTSRAYGGFGHTGV